MPGHVKRGGTGEPDPDPSPYLFVSYDDKQKDLAKVCIRMERGILLSFNFLKFINSLIFATIFF